MTVSASQTSEFTIAGVINAAYRRAGLLSVYGTLTQPQVAAAAVELELVIKGLGARGLTAREIRWYTLTLANGVWQYTLPEQVFDVIGVGMYADPSQPVTQMNTPDVVGTVATVEIPIKPIARDRFQRIGAKGASSRPSLYYVERTGAQVILYLWPIPGATEDQGHARFQTHQWRADATDPNATIDVERYWQDTITWELAFRLAVISSLPLDRCGLLQSQASAAYDEAKSMSYQRADGRVVIGHRTGWSR